MSDEHEAAHPYDDLLDRLFSGQLPDLERAFRDHPELTPEERRSLASLAEALKGGDTEARPEGALPDGGLPFTSIGEFRIVRRLGEGSIGMVFLAEQPSLGRLVAVKVLRPGLVLSPEADARLTREAQTLARLRHPNVVTAFSYGRDHGVHFLAMEYVEGLGLDEIVSGARSGTSRPSAVQVTGWCRDVARALQAAHQAGIIHRDVKPSNIRITPAGQAILLDFGLALDRPDSTLTTAGAFRGSPRYSSPEQVDPRGAEIDHRTDVYSLGVTLYEAVTLRPAFQGATTEAVFARILSGDVDPPRTVAPGIPRELETVILTAIERDRERRYPTAAAFADDLDALLELRDIIARPPGIARRVRKWVRRKPVAAALVAAIVVAIMAGAVVVATRRIADQRAFAREVAAASEAAGRGAFDDALAAWDRALGLMPASPEAIARRADAVRLRDQSRAESLLAEARAHLDRAKAARERADGIQNTVTRLREEMLGRTLDPEEGRLLARGDGRARAFRLDQETAYHAALNRAHDARALAPESAEPRALLADLYMERWREAVARKDAASERSLEKLVAEHDLAGAHRDEIAGLGSVAFEIAPEGAEVHLFRYEEQADVVPDGERRLVPVPINGAPVPVPPGSWCLRPVWSGGGIESEDLIFEIEGHPIQGRLFLIPTRPPIEPFDVLVSVDGHPVDNYVDFVERIKRPEKPATRRSLIIEGKAGRYELETASFDDLGTAISMAPLSAFAAAFEATIWHRGAVRRTRLPKGIYFRCTAAPLFLSDGCSLGRVPIADAPLTPGSYLAYISHPEREPLRFPFVVERRGRTRVACSLRPPRSTPGEYRYVPAGVARVGRPHAAGTGSIAAADRHVGGFAILDHEVTIGDFLEFLNDDTVSEEWKRAPELMVWNRTRTFSVWNQITRNANGKFEIGGPGRNFPVSGVSFDQAEAYVQWLTAMSAATSRPTRYALPTDVEWEKAARGTDGRSYAYGRVFHALWQKSARSSLKMTPDWVMRFPVDESPYGVFDLTGSQLEWCDRSEATKNPGDSRTLRGTAWSLWEDRNLFTEWEFSKKIAMAEAGFRLVIRDAEQESRPAAETRPDPK